MTRIKRPIAVKVILAVAVLVGLVVFVFASFAALSQRRIYETAARWQQEQGIADIRKQGIAMSKRLAAALGPAIAENNFTFAKELVTNTLRDEPNLKSVTIVDPKGLILVSNNSALEGKQAKARTNRAGKSWFKTSGTGKNRIMEVAGPILDKETLLGEVAVVYSLAFLEQQRALITKERDASTQRLIVRSFSIGGLCVLVGIILAVIVGLSMTRPIKALATTASQLAAGNLDARSAVRTRDEIGQLSTVFNNMAGHIKRLLSETEEKIRLETELEVARTVQEALLPDASRPLVLETFEAAAFYRPASVCGGDWWEHFVLGDKVYIIVADVTGHGVPAAMITASAKSGCDLTRRLLGDDLTVVSLMRGLNHALYSAGGRTMLMTCHISAVDLKTHEVTFASAGHNMPYVMDAERATQPRILAAIGNRLGDQPSWDFHAETEQLGRNELIFWYTDGLTEGESPEKVEFGPKRLRRTLKHIRTNDVQELRDQVVSMADEFYGIEPQGDDITFVVGKLT